MTDAAKTIAKEIYKAFERLDAPIELLAIVGSYRDTLDDEEVAALLKEYNQRGEYMDDARKQH